MTHDLQQTRYDQLIRRVGAIIGPGSKVSEALSELFPVIDVERVPGELLLLGGTQLCMGSFALTPTAAERTHLQLFNPVNSGKIATVSSLWIHTPSSVDDINIARSNTALTDGQGTEVFRDTRLDPASRPSCQIRSDSLVAVVDANFVIRLRLNESKEVKDENGVMILLPGNGLNCGPISVDVRLHMSVFWRERIAEQSELFFP